MISLRPPALVWLLIGSLAVFRLSWLVSRDYGLFHISDRLRKWVGRRAAGRPRSSPWFHLAELLHCPFCNGVWLAVPVALALFIWPSWWTDLVGIILALAGMQVIILLALKQWNNH